MSNEPTVWFTGLSRSGMTTLAESLATFLRDRGKRVEILDGKLIRDEMGDFFGYSKEERIKVSRVLCVMARLLARHNIIPIVTSITPYQESRDFNRRELQPYTEIYVDCPVEVCETRDVEGLYKRAIRGDLKHFVGVDDPYEIPKNPDFRIDTAHEAVDACTSKINAYVAGVLVLS